MVPTPSHTDTHKLPSNRCSGVEIPALALEAAVRTYSAGGQWKRAGELFDTLLTAGSPLHETTVLSVFDALATGKQGSQCSTLLAVMSTRAAAKGFGEGALSKYYNLTVRALVKEGASDAALTLLTRMAMDDDIVVQRDTFNVVAAEMLRSGRTSDAEEVMELRDFL
ncbi:hypothetical protein FOA52_000072 [Chlamydomonas sp. UWO 241]|nr:hypothetical protein FOA52_000072 [Chlamydomonas sp. UWO 241]